MQQNYLKIAYCTLSISLLNYNRSLGFFRTKHLKTQLLLVTFAYIDSYETRTQSNYVNRVPNYSVSVIKICDNGHWLEVYWLGTIYIFMFKPLMKVTNIHASIADECWGINDRKLVRLYYRLMISWLCLLTVNGHESS